MGKPLKAVPETVAPPRALGKHGYALWCSIHAGYNVEDAGGLAMLALACECLDRAEMLREEIDRDGATIRLKNGALKDHPALKHELGNRSFVVRTLQRLGLDVEPIRPIGRPPGAWSIA
jgi:hypothetical protein